MNLFTWGEKKVQKFSIWDIGVFKVYLFSIGIIFGVYFSEFFLANIYIIFTVAITSFGWLLYKMFTR
jgi:hypothetical protein